MKQLIIIGAGGFGREVSEFAKNCVGYGIDFVIKGFLDDDINALSNFNNYPKIISTIKEYEIDENDVFICSIGSLKTAFFLTNLMLDKKAIFINLIHKSAEIRKNVSLGIGLIIGSNSVISTDVVIGNFTQIMSNVIIGHDSMIDDFCRIGDMVFIGGNSVIKSNTFIAVNSTILANITVEKNSIIGAGSVVIKSIKNSGSYFGNPAKRIEF
jgi:sugar O-acyltransferase (sialic acid O-acetyltransferase NeuD family)